MSMRRCGARAESISTKSVLCAAAAISESMCNGPRSEEHTSELQSLMRISYAVFCLKKKKQRNISSKQLAQKVTATYIPVLHQRAHHNETGHHPQLESHTA